MSNDRFLFVAASFAAAALILALRQTSHSQKTIQVGKLTITVRALLVVLVILAIVASAGIYILNHMTSLSVESVVPLLIGAVFGSFAVRFIASLFGPEFGKRDPLIGAIILVLLSVGYSLPLYSEALSNILSGIGLSGIKTPFLELTLQERGNKSFTIAAVGASETPGSLPRSGDPGPGLKWLGFDTGDAPSDTLPSDEEYIRSYESGIYSKPEYQARMKDIKKFLLPARTLSDCLKQYVEILPDSGLLLVDIKPVIESLFMLHVKSKKDLNSEHAKSTIEFSSPAHFWHEVKSVIESVGNKFATGGQPVDWVNCNDNEISETTEGPIIVNYLQPYNTLILADLLVAHGSTDEAISVLAEWLTDSTAFRKTHPAAAKNIPEWFELRIASRISLLMADIGGQNNLAYRDFFKNYKERSERYFASQLSLDQISTKCKTWTDHSQNLLEQKVLYILLANEDELLRTEINFIGEESNFETLEQMNRRADFVASVEQECLPNNFPPRLRAGTVADHRVTAGLVGLTVADRMSAIARSRGDRDRASDIARDAEKFLRSGNAELTALVIEDRKNLNNSSNWSERVFGESPWEKSASLASRAMLQLRNGNSQH